MSSIRHRSRPIVLVVVALAIFLACSSPTCDAANLRAEQQRLLEQELKELLVEAATMVPSMENTVYETFDPSVLEEILEYEFGERDDDNYDDDALEDVDDYVLEEAEEFLFDEDEDYNGCYCDCAETDAGYAPDTVKMYEVGVDGDGMICVTDLESVVYNTEGMAVCDETCLLEDLKDEQEEDAKDSEEDN